MPNLILSRKRGESVNLTHSDLPENILVTVIDIIGGKVRLGFQADPSVIILRPELLGKEVTSGTH